jgi:hypothetical protein
MKQLLRGYRFVTKTSYITHARMRVRVYVRSSMAEAEDAL